MSRSSSVRVLGVCGLWLAVLAGCGGNPEVSNVNPSEPGGGSGGSAATSAGGKGGGFVIPMGGDGSGNEGGDTGTPTEFECGNRELEPGEFCDDGNTDDGDGCSSDCKEVDLDYDCSVVGEPCVQVVICGNGVLEGSELCDDGNTSGGDGCSADCSTVEDGWVCIRPGRDCVELPVCGNGVRDRGEECDDGQATPMSGDGCDEQCQLEVGYFCPTPGQPCVQQVCGDGVRTPNEACDDGDTDDGDGCSSLCVVEAGWRCNANGCQPICGDGLVRGAEACDDANRTSGDGCSSACVEEPFYTCAGQPSTCTSSIACGNGVVEPGEICDPPGQNGCGANCTSFNPDTSDPAVCNNGVIEDGETCEPIAVGSGCSATCQVENGWTCPQAGVCFRNPFCGDNIVQATRGEECDPPSPGNGCSATCQEESGWICVGLGPSTCVQPVCGNGVVDPGEQCDDGNNTNPADGCHNCAIATGWACPTQGAPCIPRCGDGLVRGVEECDDGNPTSGDGCNAGCKIEPGFSCPTPNAACVAAVCGDGVVDKGEGCDDGGICVGGSNAGNVCTQPSDCPGGGAVCRTVAGDGCGATCQPEPTVTLGADPVVNVFCGDGLVTGDEECDDGNNEDGDGCDQDCFEEPGWACNDRLTLPSSLQMRVTYRDFKSSNALTPGGHPDFQYNTFNQVLGITGDVCTSANTATCGRLDSQGKPVLIRTGQQDDTPGPGTNGTGIMSSDTFGLWFRDTNPTDVAGYNGPIEITPFTRTLTLNQQGGANSEVYSFSSGAFFPLAGTEGFGNIGNEVELCNVGMGTNNGVRNQANNCNGCGATCRSRNFGFTSELRYFFQYKGGETLIFTGDDDVWVYVNGKLAVDIGGLHSQQSGQVVLGDGNSSCSVHGGGVAVGDLPNPGTAAAPGCYSAGERASDLDNRFGLQRGEVYEIVLFHAERHTDASNFRLTLAGFLAPRTFCEAICGDGVIVGDEACDDGPNNSDTASGACNTTCTARAYCGDAVRQLPGEACDNGTNTDLYMTAASPPGVCAPGCVTPASCGDGTLQPAFEQCDNGAQNNDASYGPTSCRTNCTLGGYCGDGMQNGNEACDLGAQNGQTYGENSCGYNCQPGPRCGDDIRNGAEQCDDGAENGTATSHCDVDCTIKPYCGDGVKQPDEVCDYGQFASDNYGGCTNMCEFGPLCGDGTLDDPYEECDDGAAGNTGGYDGCTATCNLGPHCGDGVTQAGNGEVCDNGFNDDDYAYDPATSCAAGCQPPPSCGDGVKQPAHELCDNGAANDDDAYEGCTTSCEYGPYCGDGFIDTQGGEMCDDGRDNVTYSPEEGGCSYDCQPAPFCGDGTRNGPEQCDLGSANNNGQYGGCNANCTFAPRCGDGIRQGNEECDAGPAGSLACTPTCKRRNVVE